VPAHPTAPAQQQPKGPAPQQTPKVATPQQQPTTPAPQQPKVPAPQQQPTTPTPQQPKVPAPQQQPKVAAPPKTTTAPTTTTTKTKVETDGPPIILEEEIPDLPPLKVGSDGKVTMDTLLLYSVEINASDLHVKAGAVPTIRSSGLLYPLDYHLLPPAEAQELADQMMGEKEKTELEARGEVDFAYSLKGAGRFRVNIHHQRGSVGIATRRILPNAPDFKDLGLPHVIEKLSSEHRGLLLITGPTSSGKTTTCGAIIKHINHTRRCHIVTIEDPIEILHPDELALVTQREIGQDTTTFNLALRAAMRQDPDVIFVGEIRDTETVQAALQAAETGHFVLATLHTTDVVETINRIVDFFPSHQHKQVRAALAGSLAGILTQRLLPKIGGGRVPAIEVLVNNGRIQECIVDSDKTPEIHDIVADSGFYGMQTFDQALTELFREGLVTLEDATSAANRPHDFHLALQQAGLLAV
jgi:twitching motility protein PilT